MSSKIRLPEESQEFTRFAWSGWNTDYNDPGAPTAPASAHPEPAVSFEMAETLRLEAEEAYRRGCRDGESAARAACRRELEEAVRQFTLATQNAVAEKGRVRAEAEFDVVRIALAIARKILHREVRIDPTVALGLVKAAVATVGARELHVVRTTPSLAASLTGGLDSMGLPEGAKVIADSSLEFGGLVVETSRGEVDASLETQFEEISRGLLQAVGDPGRRL